MENFLTVGHFLESGAGRARNEYNQTASGYKLIFRFGPIPYCGVRIDIPRCAQAFPKYLVSTALLDNTDSLLCKTWLQFGVR